MRPAKYMEPVRRPRRSARSRYGVSGVRRCACGIGGMMIWLPSGGPGSQLQGSSSGSRSSCASQKLCPAPKSPRVDAFSRPKWTRFCSRRDPSRGITAPFERILPVSPVPLALSRVCSRPRPSRISHRPPADTVHDSSRDSRGTRRGDAIREPVDATARAIRLAGHSDRAPVCKRFCHRSAIRSATYPVA